MIKKMQLWTQDPGQGMVSDLQWQNIADLSDLSARELQVCQLLFEGKTRQQVADDLGIKGRTARQYVEKLYEKLRVTSRAALVLRIVQIRDLIAEQQETA